MALIQNFQQDFELFKDRFESLGGLLDKVKGKYDEITGTSYKRLDNRVAKIDAYRKGGDLLPEIPESEQEPISVLPPSEA